MSENYKTYIKFNTAITVANLFAIFSNEKYRGEKFTWENFPDFAGRHCEVNIITCLKSDRYLEEAKELSKNFAIDLANDLVKIIKE